MKDIQEHTPFDWKDELITVMPLLGHRNWILIVDKAYPLQSAPGIRYIETKEELLPVLDCALHEITVNSQHIKPVIYNDLELTYFTDDLVDGIEQFRKEMGGVLKKYDVQTLLHEEVFRKLDEASKLFEVVVLKTETTKPYTSVFIELDCGYWSAEKEKELRERMR